MSDQLTRVLKAVDDQADALIDPPGQPLPNARRFVTDEYNHPERPLLVHQGGVFYGWDGTSWPEIDDAELRSRLYQWADLKSYVQDTGKGTAERRAFAPNRNKVADLVDALRAAAHIPTNVVAPSWFHATHDVPADELIACQNGLVHVRTRSQYPLTPDYYAHNAVAFDFDCEARLPQRWLRFLEDLWGDDTETIQCLQEIFGYLLSGDTRLQKMFLIVGPKRSGKGTLARILKAMLGPHNVAGPTLSGLATNFGLSALIGKPAAIISDARLNASDSSTITERLLSVSGEDTLTVDRKYREPWTGQLSSRFIILTNELPRMADSSGALASRFIVLTMTQSFYGKENTRLTDELTVELPGIFNWALDGLERLRERGSFLQPAASIDAIRDLEDLGSPIGAFIRDACCIGAEFTASYDGMYAAWVEWCETAGRSHPTTKATFGRDLRAAIPGLRTIRQRIADGSRQRSYAGIGLGLAGPRTTPMLSQVSIEEGPYARHNNLLGPARTTNDSNASSVILPGPCQDLARPMLGPGDDKTQSCPRCRGEGCRYCGETGRNPESL